MPINFHRELAVAVDAVREAAALCQAVQRQVAPDGLEKKDRSPVTVADFGSQALICRAIREAFPHDPIVAEEDSDELRQPENAGLAGRVAGHVRRNRQAELGEILDWIDFGGASDYSERFWTLDPIDGTKGFLRGEQYAVALALIVGGQVQVAALACPNLAAYAAHESVGCLVAAVREQGTTLFPLAGGDGAPLHVSSVREATLARMCESVESGHSQHDDAANVSGRLGITSPPERLDSQAKYAVVAQGAAEIYLRLPTRADYREKIWDHAAGALLVEEAGGRVTDIAGRRLEFRHGSELTNNRGVVATNGWLHDEVLKALTACAVR